MKKTLTINISGIIFHIDEDAYDKLNAYLDTLKRHFTNTQGKDEIISDIEGRIAELLQERMSDAKQVVSIDDISEVITLMGEPGEFETESEADEEKEPAMSAEDIKGPKRLYRDPDKKVVGGVAAGLAAYLNIDILWVRLAFVICSLIWLSGAMVYIILWIAMPEARTTAEKLQMKGEKVNISNIEKSIKEEVSHLKDKINDLTNQAKKKVEKTSKDSESVFEQLISVFITILKVFLKIIVIIIGIALMLAGIGLVIAFLFALFGWGGPVILDNNEALLLPMTDFFTLLPISGGGMAILKIGLVMFIGIPLLMLMYNAFRMIFGFDRLKYIGITAFNIWIVGLIITLFFSFRVAREYRHHLGASKELIIQQPVSDTLFITIEGEQWKQLEYNSYDYIYTNDIHLVVTEDGEFYEQIELFLGDSDTDEFILKQFTHARGRTPKQAQENAANIEWFFTQDENTLFLDPFYLVGTKGEWRAQHIELELLIPVGKYIQVDESVGEILGWGVYNPRRMAGKTWRMTEDGLVGPGDEGFISPTLYIEEKQNTEAAHPMKPIMMHMVNLVW